MQSGYSWSSILRFAYCHPSLLSNNILVSPLLITCGYLSPVYFMYSFAKCSQFCSAVKWDKALFVEFYFLVHGMIISSWLFLNWQKHQHQSLHIWWSLATIFYLRNAVFLFFCHRQMWRHFFILFLFFLFNLFCDSTKL